MSRAYVLDRATRDILAPIEQSWETLEYTRRYFGMDTFQLAINRSRRWAGELRQGRLLYLPDEGDRLFLIEQMLDVAEGSAGSDHLTVAGRSLEGIGMASRRVLPPAGQDYDKQTAIAAETAMKHYVDFHAGPGAPAARELPGLVIAASGGAGPAVTVAGRYQRVFDIVREIGLLAGIGWEITYDPVGDDFVFDTIVGVDRSASVFFDFAFDTLNRWEELESILESSTVAIVAGQGEGKDRNVATRWEGTEPTGFDRREEFIDARDVGLGDTAGLNLRGDAFLAAASPERRFEADVHQHGSFRYGEHWDLGDIVLARNVPRGIAAATRIVEVKKAFTASSAAPAVTAVLDRPFPTIREEIQGAGPVGGAVDYPDTLNPKVDSLWLSRLNPDVKLSRSAAGKLLLNSGGAAVASVLAIAATAGQQATIVLQRAGDSDARVAIGDSFGGATAWPYVAFGTGAVIDFLIRRDASKAVVIDDAAGGAVSIKVVGTIEISDHIKRGGLQVVGARRTGWGGSTGFEDRSSFDTETVSLIDLARHMRAMVIDLTAHGLIGA